MTDSTPPDQAAPAPPASQNGQDASKSRVEWTRDQRLALWSNIASFVNVGAALAAFVLLVQTLRITQDSLTAARDAVAEARAQVVQAQRQADTAGDTEYRQLRAYVGIQSVTVRPITDGQRLTADIVIKNFGQTPASDLRIAGQPVANEKPDFSEKVLGALDRSAPESLFPAAERPFIAYGRLLRSWDVYNRPSSVTTTLVYGIIRYQDIFGATHTTEFCHMVSPGQTGHQSTDACQGHNNHN